MRDGWIVYTIFGVLVCLLLWRVATQWKVKSVEAENLRASLIILGVVAFAMVVWQCARLLPVGATNVWIDVSGQTITASITNEAVDDLKLEKGKTAYAIIKATSVMVGVD